MRKMIGTELKWKHFWPFFYNFPDSMPFNRYCVSSLFIFFSSFYARWMAFMKHNSFRKKKLMRCIGNDAHSKYELNFKEAMNMFLNLFQLSTSLFISYSLFRHSMYVLDMYMCSVYVFSKANIICVHRA